MNYKYEYYYKVAYFVTGIILMPFFVKVSDTKSTLPVILGTALVLATEYAYVFPREAIKLYEKIIFKSSIEKRYKIIELIIFISLAAVEIYYFTNENIVPMAVFILLHLLLNTSLKNQSVIIGDRSFIIGSKAMKYNHVNRISFEEKKAVFYTAEGTFKVRNIFIDNNKKELEKIAEIIAAKKLEDDTNVYS